MRVKIVGGTAQGEEDLCATCRMSAVRMSVEGRKTVYCNVFNKVWKEPTSECSTYSDKRVPFLHDLKEIAWLVEPSNRQKAGFRPVPLDGMDRLHKAIEELGDE